ncbi:hypothetical protein GCM10010520_32890 [Rhizobium viscosum]
MSCTAANTPHIPNADVKAAADKEPKYRERPVANSIAVIGFMPVK